jgi:hypothetical protein
MTDVQLHMVSHLQPAAHNTRESLTRTVGRSDMMIGRELSQVRTRDAKFASNYWLRTIKARRRRGVYVHAHRGRLQDLVVAGVCDPGTVAGIRWRARLRRCEPRRPRQKTRSA